MTQSKKKPLHVCTCSDCRRHPRSPVAKLHRSVNRVVASLDEKSRRRLAGLLATQQGWGGIQQMARVTGMSRTTILRGQREIERAPRSRRQRIRTRGGGRQRVEKNSRTSGTP
jgi:predicted metal-dependent phosphoesterase TrpH